jgi:hypothetical protein
VFERFYRADSSRHRVAGTGEGGGLGLSIVAATAAAHQGAAVLLVMHLVVGLSAYYALTRIAPPRLVR